MTKEVKKLLDNFSKLKHHCKYHLEHLKVWIIRLEHIELRNNWLIINQTVNTCCTWKLISKNFRILNHAVVCHVLTFLFTHEAVLNYLWKPTKVGVKICIVLPPTSSQFQSSKISVRIFELFRYEISPTNTSGTAEWLKYWRYGQEWMF